MRDEHIWIIEVVFLDFFLIDFQSLERGYSSCLLSDWLLSPEKGLIFLASFRLDSKP